MLGGGLLLAVAGVSTLAMAPLDLTQGSLVFAPGVSLRVRAAAATILPAMWTVAKNNSGSPRSNAVALRPDPALGAGAFSLHADGAGVQLAASSDQGFIMGAGRLLRELRVHSSGSPILLPTAAAGLRILVAPPAGQFRGPEFTTALVGTGPLLQPGGFSTWANAERYVRELAIFGGNAVELAHAFTGDPAEVAALRNYSILLDKCADLGSPARTLPSRICNSRAPHLAPPTAAATRPPTINASAHRRSRSPYPSQTTSVCTCGSRSTTRPSGSPRPHCSPTSTSSPT